MIDEQFIYSPRGNKVHSIASLREGYRYLFRKPNWPQQFPFRSCSVIPWGLGYGTPDLATELPVALHELNDMMQAKSTLHWWNIVISTAHVIVEHPNSQDWDHEANPAR